MRKNLLFMTGPTQYFPNPARTCLPLLCEDDGHNQMRKNYKEHEEDRCRKRPHLAVGPSTSLVVDQRVEVGEAGGKAWPGGKVSNEKYIRPIWRGPVRKPLLIG